MENRGGKVTFLGVLVIVIGLIAVIHTMLQLSLYLTGTGKISGFALLESPKLKEVSSLPKFQPISIAFIAAEWLFLLTVVIIGRTKKKTGHLNETTRLVNEHRKNHSDAKTDLDILYAVLKDKKEVYLQDITGAFEIDKGLAMEWMKMLEESELAKVEYSNGEAYLRKI